MRNIVEMRKLEILKLQFYSALLCVAISDNPAKTGIRFLSSFSLSQLHFHAFFIRFAKCVCVGRGKVSPIRTLHTLIFILHTHIAHPDYIFHFIFPNKMCAPVNAMAAPFIFALVFVFCH